LISLNYNALEMEVSKGLNIKSHVGSLWREYW